MAVYRIGDILRMKREALGITREKLCEMSGEICSPQTLYRMECGRVKVKRETYQQLMRCMGQLPERNYASIRVPKNQYLSIRADIYNHLVFLEYDKAEEKLRLLEQVLDQSYPRNRQYLRKNNATLAYKLSKIDAEEYQRILIEALRCTIPQWNEDNMEKWPYNEQEMEIVFNIIETYHALDLKDKHLEACFKLKQNIERHYMDDDYYVMWYAKILTGIVWINSNNEQYDMSIEYCSNGFHGLVKNRCLNYSEYLMYEKSICTKLNCVQSTMTELLSSNRQFVYAYYLSVAQNMLVQSEFIRQNAELFGINSLLLL